MCRPARRKGGPRERSTLYRVSGGSTDVVARMMDKLSGGSQRAAVERALAFIDRLGGLRGAPAGTLKAGPALLVFAKALPMFGDPLRTRK